MASNCGCTHCRCCVCGAALALGEHSRCARCWLVLEQDAAEAEQFVMDAVAYELGLSPMPPR